MTSLSGNPGVMILLPPFFFHKLEIADWVGEMPSLKDLLAPNSMCVCVPHHKIYVNINCHMIE